MWTTKCAQQNVHNKSARGHYDGSQEVAYLGATDELTFSALKSTTSA